MTKNRFCGLPGVLFIAFAFAIQVLPAHAGMVSTDEVLSPSNAQTERDELRAFTDRADVQRLLEAQGVPPDAAKARIDALTDTEVRTLAGRIEALPAGGALSDTDWILILLIAILVALAL